MWINCSAEVYARGIVCQTLNQCRTLNAECRTKKGNQPPLAKGPFEAASHRRGTLRGVMLAGC
jgi:hypothetical protein